jgi:branched-chain amino acid transport system ATP-binding protein
MPELVIEVRNLTVAYGPIRAIQDVGLELPRGETVAIVGANGAGKTTLLRALSGMMPAQSGEIVLEGRSIKGLPSHELAQRGMLHLPEGRGTLGTLSVIENLLIAYEARPSATPFEQALAQALARFPRLGERRTQMASNLSGGEQQMLALARVIVNPPKLLLVDEPSMGLSPLFVSEVFRVLREFRGLGMTILIVEQNVRRALQLADRGYVLRQGRIVLGGAASDLLKDDRFVRSYLGSSSRSAQ